MLLKALIDDSIDWGCTTRAQIDQLISDHQMALPTTVVQALVDIFHEPRQDLTGEDARLLQ